MPELPEVEVVRRGIADHVVGRQIVAATLSGHRVARRHDAGPADLLERATGARVEAADRRGKYLWCVLARPHEDPMALVIHLGMSGQLLVQDAASPSSRHTHATFAFADEGPDLRFVDQRTFGGLSLVQLTDDRHGTVQGATDASGASESGSATTQPGHPYGVPSSVSHIAPDPLESAYDEGAVVRRLKTRHTAVKRSLLDQGIVSGIGNIYADEALWRAKIHGRRECSALSKPALTRVLRHAQDVMRAALDVGGTSFDSLYVNVNGASGYFDRSLDAYGQTGAPCSRCGRAIVREQFMNRSSHFCPRCQPKPRVPRLTGSTANAETRMPPRRSRPAP
ncbi:MAG: bifunctional DNA-formamidopyrimidine glycosylase/DNA-(apurinic or apyrimidinic site) lyase [Ornithinimicrobium sp.]